MMIGASKKGLSSSKAREILLKHGHNELPSAQSKSIWKIAQESIKEPMFLLLLSCGSLYMMLGDYGEGAILLAGIFMIIFITFYQYNKTENALAALRNLSAPRALVLRDGQETRIAGNEVVPDDVIILNEGDRIAADARILECTNLIVDESLLTGESIPVSKNVTQDTSDLQGLVFSGTMVVRGKGFALVTETGIKTQFGKIGTSLNIIEKEQTRLQSEMKALVRNLFLIGVFVSVGVVLVFYLTRGDFVQSLLNGLANAMAILPEEFPVVLTIFMALGAWRLSRNKVLTRNPSAIETLGSATVLCSDKTGTITQNKMEIAALYNGTDIFFKNAFSDNQQDISDLISAAYHASQSDSTDPMEKAMGKAYKSLIDQANSSHLLIKEYPLSPDLLMMTRVVHDVSDEALSVFAKGAPEAVIQLCKINSEETVRHMNTVHQMADKGFRVIAVANTTIKNGELPEAQQDFNYHFLGLVGLLDPIRDEVPQAIRECKEAGIKVIMITGDFPATARNIAMQIGLDSELNTLTGHQMQKMSDGELSHAIKTTNVFARVVPEQKLRIVRALKTNNEIVAMTGDGVNDAPALKAAHIGIAMGNKGTDVAREAASLVLLDDNFASIVFAIRSGRRIFDNLQKAMSYIIAIHVPIIGLALIPAFMPSLTLILFPLHIVFMELIIDPICSIAFESETAEKNIMRRIPRNPNEKFFGSRKIWQSLLRGLLLLSVVLFVYFLSVNEGHSDGEIRAISFSALIVCNMFLILTSLSKTRNVLTILAKKNIAAMLILISATILLLLIISVPFLSRLFSFDFPGYSHFIPSFSGAFIMLFIFEMIKYFQNKKDSVK